MKDDRLRFYKTKGSSLSVLNYVIDEMGIHSKRYVRFDDVMLFIESLSDIYWLPSYIERYTSNNFTSHTGLNVKYIDCCFCGEVGVVYTKEERGVSGMDFTCSKRCGDYYRMKKKCSNDFFKYIGKRHKQSQMTEMLFALSRRAKKIERLMK